MWVWSGIHGGIPLQGIHGWLRELVCGEFASGGCACAWNVGGSEQRESDTEINGIPTFFSGWWMFVCRLLCLDNSCSPGKDAGAKVFAVILLILNTLVLMTFQQKLLDGAGVSQGS